MERIFIIINSVRARRYRLILAIGVKLNVRDGVYFLLGQDVNVLLARDQPVEMSLIGKWVETNYWNEETDPYLPPQGVTLQMRAHIPSRNLVEIDITRYIRYSTLTFAKQFRKQYGELLVLKYVPANRLNDIIDRQRLFASNTPGFTWGDAVYATPLEFPYSTMMYGCAGIIGSINPVTIFDGTNPVGLDLYRRWIETEFYWYDLLTTTVHADFANRVLRNRFRSRFGIDCVYFTPDQFARRYVNRRNDIWFALTKWSSSLPRKVSSGPTNIVQNLEFSLLLSEEFLCSTHNFTYHALLGTTLRMRNTRALPLQLGHSDLEQTLRDSYYRQRTYRNEPVLVAHEIP